MSTPEIKFNPSNKVVPVHVMRAIAVQWPPAHRAFLANRHYRALYDHTIGGTRELLTRGGEVEWEVLVSSNVCVADDGVRRFNAEQIKGSPCMHKFWPREVRVVCNVLSAPWDSLSSVTIYEHSGVCWKVEFSGGSVWNLQRNDYAIIGAKTRYWVAPHIVEARERVVHMARCLLRLVARLTCMLAGIEPLLAPSLIVLGGALYGGGHFYLREDKGECENLDALCFEDTIRPRLPTAVTKRWREVSDTVTTLSPLTPINPMTATSSTASPS